MCVTQGRTAWVEFRPPVGWLILDGILFSSKCVPVQCPDEPLYRSEVKAIAGTETRDPFLALRFSSQAVDRRLDLCALPLLSCWPWVSPRQLG